jgi:PPOX class probable F420-dependent enzyme
MSATLPDPVKEWIDGPIFATLGTIEPDGRPQLTVLWVGRDGDDILMSTTTNRRKYANMQRDPRVTVSVFPPETPYKHAEIFGTVTFEDEGSTALIDAFAEQYMGADRYPFDDGTDNVRITLRIRPDRVVTNA